jgi:hypothetical protein
VLRFCFDPHFHNLLTLESLPAMIRALLSLFKPVAGQIVRGLF